jgi:hypothetical protein
VPRMRARAGRNCEPAPPRTRPAAAGPWAGGGRSGPTPDRPGTAAASPGGPARRPAGAAADSSRGSAGAAGERTHPR